MGKQFDASALRAAIEEVKRQTLAFDPSVVRGSDAVVLLRLFSEGEAACAAGKAGAARRVETSNAHLEAGFRDPASFVATHTGISRSEAAGTLVTARRLESLPETSCRFRSGQLSPTQVAEVAKAASVDPRAEGPLLDLASRDCVRALSVEANRVAAVRNEQASFERAHRSRSFRVRRVDDYCVETFGRFTTADWATVSSVLEPLRKQMFSAARRDAKRDSYEAYSADALVEMARLAAGADTGGSSIRPSVNVVVDHQALVRGHVEPGERCEIPGVGPVPVSVVKAMESDCYLRVLVTRGHDVLALGSESRYIPASVRAALQLSDKVCSVRGCDVTVGLELDHRKPVCDGGKTKFENLDWLCRHHHYLKTHKGHRLVGERGDTRLIAPHQEAPEVDSDTGEHDGDRQGAVDQTRLL